MRIPFKFASQDVGGGSEYCKIPPGFPPLLSPCTTWLRNLFQTPRNLFQTPCASRSNSLRRMWAAARKSWKSLRAFPLSSRLAPHGPVIFFKLHAHPLGTQWRRGRRRARRNGISGRKSGTERRKGGTRGRKNGTRGRKNGTGGRKARTERRKNGTLRKIRAKKFPAGRGDSAG